MRGPTRLPAGDGLIKSTKIVALVLALMAVFPLLRIVLRWEITMNGSPVPMWMSFAAFLVLAGLSVTLWREARKG